MNFFKKLTQKKVDESDPKYMFQMHVKEDGLEYASKRMGEELAKIFISNLEPSHELVKQFVLEELDAARQGNEVAVNFVRESGFLEHEYLGAMKSSKWGDDSELETLQTVFRTMVNQFSYDMESMTSLMLGTLDSILKQFELGKYERKSSEFTTITFLNRLVTVGANQEFINAVCAIWYLQASNDPNTAESQRIAGGIIGTLENFFVEEARAVDAATHRLFTDTITTSQYGALFYETQPIYAKGRNEVLESFPANNHSVMDIYSHYANVMLQTTNQDKQNMLDTLRVLAEYIDQMCGLANQAENDFI